MGAQGHSSVAVNGRIVRADSPEALAHKPPRVATVQDYQQALAAQQAEMQEMRDAVKAIQLTNEELVAALKANTPPKERK